MPLGVCESECGNQGSTGRKNQCDTPGEDAPTRVRLIGPLCGSRLVYGFWSPQYQEWVYFRL